MEIWFEGNHKPVTEINCFLIFEPALRQAAKFRNHF